MTGLITWFYVFTTFAQDRIKGRVVHKDPSGKEQPLPGANVYWSDFSEAVSADEEGFFFLRRKPGGLLVASYLGFKNDTLQEKGRTHFHFILEDNSKELDEVEVKSNSSFISRAEPTHVEYVTVRELQKAPCCNLSESFETNASVDVSTSDAVSGTKQILLLGLSGVYAPLLRENIPVYDGLLVHKGLHLIPGTSISNIAISKGPGSVLNGHHSMTGLINYELIRPELGDQLFFNAFGSSIGRGELNFNSNVKVSENTHTGLMLHASQVFGERDLNDDGFRDFPKARQINLMNRWQFRGEKIESQIGFRVAEDKAEGGQMGFTPSSNQNIYGIENDVRRFELFGKTGFLFPETPHIGIGTQYSFSHSQLLSNAGTKRYGGYSNRIFLNVLYQTQIKNSKHKMLFSGTYNGNFQDEYYGDSSFSRVEEIPGIAAEYTLSEIEKISLVLGARLDHHNYFGLKPVGRIHLKYSPNEQTSFRVSAGNGWRVPTPYAENPKMFPSSRLIIQNSLPQEEESVSIGLTFNRDFKFQGSKYSLTMDFFRTEFSKQIIVDYDRDYQRVYLYNLSGSSFSNSFQAQLQGSPIAGFSFTAAYKWYDVKMEMERGLTRAPFVPEHRGFLQLSYATAFDRWTFDLTTQYFGPKRIPGGEGRPVGVQVRDYSPSFFNLNFQANRKFRGFDIYAGIENLLDFRQEDPIVDPSDPFGPNFDAGLAWGPTIGRVFYGGVKLKIE